MQTRAFRKECQACEADAAKPVVDVEEEREASSRITHKGVTLLQYMAHDMYLQHGEEKPGRYPK